MIKIFCLLFFLFVSADAEEVRTTFSESTPPYVFKDGSGIVYTIVKEALAHKGHTVKPVFVDIGNGSDMFNKKEVDAVTIARESSGLKGHYSDKFMQYHNAAFVLKKNNVSIQQISDLSRYRVIGFPYAQKFLPQSFGTAVRKAGNKYQELSDQKEQTYMLLTGRVEAVVMDRHIFEFYKNELCREKKVGKNVQVQMIELFSPTLYGSVFRQKKIRNDFNEGIKHLKKTGRFDEIYKEYSNRYFKTSK